GDFRHHEPVGGGPVAGVAEGDCRAFGGAGLRDQRFEFVDRLQCGAAFRKELRVVERVRAGQSAIAGGGGRFYATVEERRRPRVDQAWRAAALDGGGQLVAGHDLVLVVLVDELAGQHQRRFGGQLTAGGLPGTRAAIDNR